MGDVQSLSSIPTSENPPLLDVFPAMKLHFFQGKTSKTGSLKVLKDDQSGLSNPLLDPFSLPSTIPEQIPLWIYDPHYIPIRCPDFLSA
jgi:hypothetical protein